MIIILCTIANVLLLGGSIQAFRAARKQTSAAYDWMSEAHRVNVSALKASTKAEEHAAKAEEHSKTTQHYAGVRLTVATNATGEGHNIGRQR